MERAVEELSELIEAPIDPETIMALRQKVTDKTVSVMIYRASDDPVCSDGPLQVYVQKRNEIMLEDTAKGYLEGRWKWNVTVEGFESD